MRPPIDSKGKGLVLIEKRLKMEQVLVAEIVWQQEVVRAQRAAPPISAIVLNVVEQIDFTDVRKALMEWT